MCALFLTGHFLLPFIVAQIFYLYLWKRFITMFVCSISMKAKSKPYRIVIIRIEKRFLPILIHLRCAPRAMHVWCLSLCLSFTFWLLVCFFRFSINFFVFVFMFRALCWLPGFFTLGTDCFVWMPTHQICFMFPRRWQFINTFCAKS